MAQVKVGSKIVDVSNPDKLLFPKSKISKNDLVMYYKDIADIMLPYLKNRPISMQRFPDGIAHEGFYQKDAAEYFPAWIKRKKIPKTDGVVNYVVINNAATLVYLANLSCITIHPWMSRIDKLDYPDRLVIDLDPSTNDFNLVRTSALRLKQLFEDLGLTCFVMTTGSRGLHIWVPLKRLHAFEYVKQFAHDVARVFEKLDPKNLTLEIRKNKRKKRIFIDWLRNMPGATSVSPYSVRPKEKGPIAMPIAWKEVEDATLTPQRYTIENIRTVIKKRGDVWKGIMSHAQSLTKARLRLNALLKSNV
ncbi:ATP-dependent DNA ligase [Candidatus Dependentiae bacterium Noda2021]|nr:ATP-dependent DNA ligase [Candidatus Dependentiae bacterium Noda2021]